jgi:hypothetical protein
VDKSGIQSLPAYQKHRFLRNGKNGKWRRPQGLSLLVRHGFFDFGRVTFRKCSFDVDISSENNIGDS